MLSGFLPCNHSTRFEISNGQIIEKDNSRIDNLIRQMELHRAGLLPDAENNLYFRHNYGAWMGNVSNDVQSIDELLMTYPEFQDYIEKGYQLLLGPGISENSIIDNQGVYCKNFLELLKEKEISGKNKVYQKIRQH